VLQQNRSRIFRRRLNVNIGFDYDDTFTRDPAGWSQIINFLTKRGHKVYIVTWRTTAECMRVHAEMQYWKVDIEGIFATHRTAKEPYMNQRGIIIDVWVDDNPRAVIKDMEKL
jgi:hypothetical protein